MIYLEKKSKFHYRFKSFDDFNYILSSCQDQQQHPAVPAEGVRRERYVAVGISDRWQVTCDM